MADTTAITVTLSNRKSHVAFHFCKINDLVLELPLRALVKFRSCFEVSCPQLTHTIAAVYLLQSSFRYVQFWGIFVEIAEIEDVK